jgi:hypothetical protein
VDRGRHGPSRRIHVMTGAHGQRLEAHGEFS